MGLIEKYPALIPWLIVASCAVVAALCLWGHLKPRTYRIWTPPSTLPPDPAKVEAIRKSLDESVAFYKPESAAMEILVGKSDSVYGRKSYNQSYSALFLDRDGGYWLAWSDYSAMIDWGDGDDSSDFHFVRLEGEERARKQYDDLRYKFREFPKHCGDAS